MAETEINLPIQTFVGIFKGKITRSFWINLDFSNNETKPFVLPYQSLLWWIGDKPNINHSVKNFSKLCEIALGVHFEYFKMNITNQSTTRKRLLTQGSTSYITHDFGGSQNLMIYYDTHNDHIFEMEKDNLTSISYTANTNLQKEGSGNDNPYLLQELATGHTKTGTTSYQTTITYIDQLK